MNRENQYEELEAAEGPIEEKSLPIRHAVVCPGRERNQDVPQVREIINLIITLYIILEIIMIIFSNAKNRR